MILVSIYSYIYIYIYIYINIYIYIHLAEKGPNFIERYIISYHMILRYTITFNILIYDLYFTFDYVCCIIYNNNT